MTDCEGGENRELKCCSRLDESRGVREKRERLSLQRKRDPERCVLSKGESTLLLSRNVLPFVRSRVNLSGKTDSKEGEERIYFYVREQYQERRRRMRKKQEKQREYS